MLLNFVIIFKTLLHQKLNDIDIILISGLNCYQIALAFFNLMALATIDDYCLDPLFYCGLQSSDVLLFLVYVLLPEELLRRCSEIVYKRTSDNF